MAKGKVFEEEKTKDPTPERKKSIEHRSDLKHTHRHTLTRDREEVSRGSRGEYSSAGDHVSTIE